jgi:hypothetical protein
MCDPRPGRTIGPCQNELAAGPGRPGPRSKTREEPPMQTVKIAARYTRYLLTSLASVAFAMTVN